MYKIGFYYGDRLDQEKGSAEVEAHPVLPRLSIVDVSFINDGRKYTYLNELFDLSAGDIVFVDGVMAGKPGRVTHVQYGFKIRRSEYKTVISRADTDVHGKFFAAGHSFLTFERDVLPSKKIRTWFLPPEKEDEYVTGFDDKEFPLETLEGFELSPKIAERGTDYFLHSHVAYLSLDDGKGYAIVNGSESYEVEFLYRNGNVSNLICSCCCSYNCKHEFAAMLQLKEFLDTIQEKYTDTYDETGYFAAVNSAVLMDYADSASEGSSLIL